MIIPAEAYLVHIFGGEVGRVGIEESTGTVVVLNEGFKVLILHNDICHAVLQLRNQSEQLSDVKRL